MTKNFKYLNVFKNGTILASVICFAFSLSSCNHSEDINIKDYGVINADTNLYNATINSLVSTDIYGRTFDEGDVASSDKRVGMFYFVWLGEHTNAGIFDVTKSTKTEDGSKAIWSKITQKERTSGLSPSDYIIQEEFDKDGNPITPTPLFEFHYFSEPLYGYYCSDDPWVLARHIELLTMSGIDYISLDLTNISIYEDNVRAVLESLLKYQQLGWKVPLVTGFMTGTDVSLNHAQRVLNFYTIFHCNPRYETLWLRDEETNKPIISLDRANYYNKLSPIVTANLKIRNTIWPFDKSGTEYDNASWMDWTYPQRVYENSDGNYMSVSVTQHVAGSFGVSSNPHIKNDDNVRTACAEKLRYFDTGGDTNYNSNRGRGWDYEQNKNIKENAFRGTNLETQWNNAINSSKQIDEVFITGWNEWIAYKLPFSIIHGGDRRLDEIYSKYYNEVTFCDTTDEEFSRDIEMTKEGYGDNFYLQNMRLTRQYKFNSSKVKYAGKYATEELDNIKWENAREYLDFTEEVFARDFDRADHQDRYVNNTNRNDIKLTRISHDDNNLYIQVETNNNIIIDDTKDNNLNILLSVKDSEKPSWEGYNFILNRSPLAFGKGKTKLEAVKTDGEFGFVEVGNYPYQMQGNVASFSIPLVSLGIKDAKDFTVDFKVSDGISDPGDIMNYYIDGDCAPIGRLNYRYNSEHLDR